MEVPVPVEELACLFRPKFVGLLNGLLIESFVFVEVAEMGLLRVLTTIRSVVSQLDIASVHR